MDRWPLTILALATSGPKGEVGLAVEGRALATLSLGEGAPRGRGLLPAVARLLDEAGVPPHGLSGIAVDLGPGSFTGVRVGVTAAKTLAYALGARVAGVLSLAAIARAAPAERTVLAVRDAGRERVYYARYGPLAPGGSGAARALEAGPARAGADALASLGRGALLVGEEAPALAARLGLEGLEAARVVPGAAHVLAEAQERLRGGPADPPHGLAPIYLQASTPERRRAGEAEAAVPASPAPRDRTPGEGPA